MSDTTTIPARRGKAAYVAANQVIRVINTHGEQVVDTWAFNRHDISEFMSMEHTRSWLRRLIPHVGDSLVTNHRRPILTVLEDTSGGIHDTLLAACDHYRYKQLAVPNTMTTVPTIWRRCRARRQTAGYAESPQLVHEHPLDVRWFAVVGAAHIDTELLHQAAR
jgi:uncharacterized protein YcgI (DUF1989 family)